MQGELPVDGAIARVAIWQKPGIPPDGVSQPQTPQIHLRLMRLIPEDGELF
jgi:hypothetical protein